ncbi:MAG: FG-GAP-like repeat-containing protein, partial [Candidatus Kryptoniota bacterium]
MQERIARSNWHLVLWLALFLFLFSTSAMGQVPTITSFSPTYGPIETTVTITGTNFNTTPANNVVYFGAVKATVTAATSTSLAVTVPIGSTYQPISVTVSGVTAYAIAPFDVTFPSSEVIDTTSFASGIGFTTGSSSPCIIANCDFDGDGKPDIVVTNYTSSNTISVYRNTSTRGSVSFASAVDFASDSNTYGVATGDLDGDGKPDLVVVNQGSNTISVYRNTSTPGSISFAPKVDFATGSIPDWITISDLDGDGKPDLVVTNEGSNTISVYRNTSTPGSISFAPKVDFTTGPNDGSIAICDLDGDGKPDLVVTNQDSNTVSVFRNTSTPGSISFASKVDFTTGANPAWVAICDLDGDGKPDLIVTNPNSNTVSVFRNTSNPGSITASSFAPKVDFTTGTYPCIGAICDLDGDGTPDLVVTNQNSNTVSVFRNTSTPGSISFAPKVDFMTGSHPAGVTICD